MVDQTEYLTPDGAAAYLSVTPKFLAHLRSYGGSPVYSKIGSRSIRYRRAAHSDYGRPRQSSIEPGPPRVKAGWRPPVPPGPLALIAAGLSVVGTGFSAIQAFNQSRYQAKVAEQNANLSRQAAQQEQENTAQAALEHYRQVARLKGSQRAAMAAGGIDVNFGSAGDLQANTEMLSREDVQRIYTQGARNVEARDFEASNYMGEANAQRGAGLGSLISGGLSIGSTALGAAAQFGQLRMKLPKSSGMSTSSGIGSGLAPGGRSVAMY